MKLQNDWVDSVINHGIDKQERRIFLFDDIDNTSIGVIIKAIYTMATESKKPIELIVGSYGGSEYDMLALYDVMQLSRAPIHTVAIGKCMSAAPLLVACGQEGCRSAAPNTFFMVHQGHGDLGGKTDEIKNDVKHWEVLEHRWTALMEAHSNKPASFWKAQCEKLGDRYFDAEQALDWGLIDHIWGKKGFFP